MKIRSLHVAYGQGNFVIGDGKSMPDWHLQKDLNLFAKRTKAAGVVVTGRKNYESFPDDYRPLPDRINIVITRNPAWVPDGPERDDVIVVRSLWEALDVAEDLPGDEILIIGGGEIYRLALEHIVIDRLYLTCVIGRFDGTVFFPFELLDIQNNYELLTDENFLKDDKNSHPFNIRSYERITR